VQAGIVDFTGGGCSGVGGFRGCGESRAGSRGFCGGEEQAADACAEARDGVAGVCAGAQAATGAVRRSCAQAVWPGEGRREGYEAFWKGGEVMFTRLIEGSTRPLLLRVWRGVLVVCGVCLLLGVAGPGVAWAGFGVESFSAPIVSQDGSADTQAGSHPFAMTTSITFNHTGSGGLAAPEGGNVKDIQVELPAGISGSVTAVPRCPDAVLEVARFCPPATQVGTLTLHATQLGTQTVPVYNMVPLPGEPARFGMSVLLPVFLDVHVRSGGDYGLTATLGDLSTEAPVVSSSLTLWGVPADPSHDEVRVCVGPEGRESPCRSGAEVRPLLTMPTACAGPQSTRLSVDSWQEPGVFSGASTLTQNTLGEPVGFDGCNRLDFSPSLAVTPESSVTDSPSGVDIDLHMPQAGLQEPEGLAEADLKNSVVALPAGVRLNPSAANGLVGCSPAQIALSSPEPAGCPGAS
jgi:hypothetical protein